jgi:hypothetical protein
VGEKQCSCNNGKRFKRVPTELPEWSTVQNKTVVRTVDVLKEETCPDCTGSGWLPEEE